jgi:hypothetical protein
MVKYAVKNCLMGITAVKQRDHRRWPPDTVKNTLDVVESDMKKRNEAV